MPVHSGHAIRGYGELAKNGRKSNIHKVKAARWKKTIGCFDHINCFQEVKFANIVGNVFDSPTRKTRHESSTQHGGVGILQPVIGGAR